MKVEIVDEATEFRFRLVDGDKCSAWTGYTGLAYLNGMVVATEYYVTADNALKLTPVTEFMESQYPSQQLEI